MKKVLQVFERSESQSHPIGISIFSFSSLMCVLVESLSARVSDCHAEGVWGSGGGGEVCP